MPISFNNVTHVYSEQTPFRYTALIDVDLDIDLNKITCIIGSTGSGKSTLVQHLNALLLPSKGDINILDRTIKSTEKPKNLKSLRKRVGLVFQFPEYQLFEETILKDVMFGPSNFNMDNIEKRSKEALNMVGIDESFFYKSPLELSGGQKRRVAIAGILAMSPDVIVLDEPTAGLDPKGSKSMMELFKRLNKEFNKTLIVVTHDMELVLNYSDEVIVMDKGRVRIKKDAKSFFNDVSILKELNIVPPNVVVFRDMLNERGFNIDKDIVDIDDMVEAIYKRIKK